MVANLYKCKIVAYYKCWECISNTRIMYFLDRQTLIVNNKMGSIPNIKYFEIRYDHACLNLNLLINACLDRTTHCKKLKVVTHRKHLILKSWFCMLLFTHQLSPHV